MTHSAFAGLALPSPCLLAYELNATFAVPLVRVRGVSSLLVRA